MSVSWRCSAEQRESLSVPRATPAPKSSPAGSDWNRRHLYASSTETPAREVSHQEDAAKSATDYADFAAFNPLNPRNPRLIPRFGNTSPLLYRRKAAFGQNT